MIYRAGLGSLCWLSSTLTTGLLLASVKAAVGWRGRVTELDGGVCGAAGGDGWKGDGAEGGRGVMSDPRAI